MKKSFLYICILLALICIQTDTLAQKQGRRAKPGSSKMQLNVPAPDFELPILKSIKDSKGNASYGITDETVKLSSLKGDKIVCFVLTSYT